MPAIALPDYRIVHPLAISLTVLRNNHVRIVYQRPAVAIDF